MKQKLTIAMELADELRPFKIVDEIEEFIKEHHRGKITITHVIPNKKGERK